MLRRNLFHKGNIVSPKRRLPGYKKVVHRSAHGRIVLEGGHSEKKTACVLRPCKRYTRQEFKNIVKVGKNGSFTIPGPDGKEGRAIMLRPQKVDYDSEPVSEKRKGGPSSFEIEEGNILVEKRRLMDSINDAIKEHSTLPCMDMNLDLVEFMPWGHYVKAKVRCTNCGYQSDKHRKLYHEVEKEGPGPKEATGNLRLQYLLQEMPIGNEKARLVLAALGIRAGSLSGMQQNANKVGEATVDLNNEDMARWTEEVKEVLQCRGIDDANIISASFDARYDGASLKSWVTPGPGANAATGVIVENITNGKKVIAMHHINKRCPLGTRLRSKGLAAKCGAGEDSHDRCTANMPYAENISEKQMAKEMVTHLNNEHDIVISHFTTDSDGLAAQGVKEAYEEKGITQVLTEYKDPIHLAGSQRRRIMNHKFQAGTFIPVKSRGPWKSQEIRKCKQALAHDVQERCAKTVTQVFNHYNHDIKKIRARIDGIVDYMMLCYKGSHKTCQTAVLAKLTGCTGAKGKTWYDLSDHLSGQMIAYLQLTEEDELFLRSVIGLKLSPEGLENIAQLTSTQKAEAVNRAINMSDPKNNHWARNSAARNAAAVHRINNGPLKSIEAKLDHGRCSLPENSPAKKAILNYGKRQTYAREYQRQETSQLRARQLKKEKIQSYYDTNFKRHNLPDYLKYQLDVLKTKRAEARLSMEDVIPGSSNDVQVAQINDHLVSCQQEVSQAKKDIKRQKKRELNQKLAIRMKKRRTWQKNVHIRLDMLKKKKELREKYYDTGCDVVKKIKREHTYASVQQ